MVCGGDMYDHGLTACQHRRRACCDLNVEPGATTGKPLVSIIHFSRHSGLGLATLLVPSP